MSAESTGEPGRLSHGWLAFRHWRWQRPFWAGLLTMVAGAPITYFPYANITFGQLTFRMATTAGSGSLIIGVLLLVLGLTMWFQAPVRLFAGVASILLALVSLVVSNVGGFVLGFLFALLGGALAVSWAPGVPVADEPAEEPLDPAGDLRDPPGVPSQDGGPRATPEPAFAGPRPDEETAEENGSHRAG